MRQIPNLLCVLRIALAPVCVLAVMHREYGWALGMCMLAGLSDFLDGYLARRMDWGTPIGAYLDPVADKVLLGATYIALGIDGAVEWWVVGLIFGRDIVILLGVALLYGRVKQKQFPPTMAGKISTTVQILAAAVVLSARVGLLPEAMVQPAVYATAGMTLASGLDYLRVAWHMMKG